MVKQYVSVFWKVHDEVLSKIEWFQLKFEDKYNKPIFILDEDPVRCAQCYVTHHITKYIEYIVYTMINLRGTPSVRKAIENKPRIDYMLHNQRTAYWFFKLYNEMQRIYKERFGREYKVSEYFKPEWIMDMTGISGPKDVKKKAYKACKLPTHQSVWHDHLHSLRHWNKMIARTHGVIGKYRFMYILLGYLLSEFPNGAPAWYGNMKATIWKAFNQMTRMYYRVDTSVEGVYSYYYSIDNKNWIEIPNVPLEMRNLIDGMMFAKETIG